MMSPQQKRWLPAAVSPSTDGKEKSKGAPAEARTPEAASNGGTPVNEMEMWRRLKGVGLDEETLQKKDKASLIAHITKLESEMYEYQYNMGLLLLERKEWTSRCEQLKIAQEEAEGNFKRDKAAHLAAIAEAEKREENLKKALGVEKQCVADLEKALHEMRAESAEIKFVSEIKLAKAHELIAATEEKTLAAESKLHKGEALQAEANRKCAEAERNLQEVGAREDELRRQRQAFKSKCEAHEKELFYERQTLQEWEKKLQEGQERLLEGQRVLNQREDYIIERSEATKQIEKEIQDIKRNVEKEQSMLKEKEADLRVKLADLTTREEALVKRETAINKKEQNLLVQQEKLASREREEIQRLTDEHKVVLEARTSEFEAELEHKRRALDDEMENKRNAADMKELEIKCKEEKISKREQQLEKKTDKLKEKEKDLDARLRTLKEREKTYKTEEKEIETQQKKLEAEREEMKTLKQALEKLKVALKEERHQINKEQERLELTENERKELRIIQTNLKEEIDSLRAKEHELLKKEDILNVEKEKFEREWEILDEKTEQLRKELEQVDDEKKRVSKWLKDEEERFKEERRMLREQIKSEEENLRIEKEAFANNKKHEEAEFIAKIERERADLYRDIELQTSEMEKSIEQRQEELERHYNERERAFQKEKQKQMQYINAQKELSDKELGEMKLERQRLDRERQEITTTREQIEGEWSEMKKDIEELQIQKEKLKEQRESLHNERKELEGQLDQLKKLKDELKMTEDSLKLSEQQMSQADVNDCEDISPEHFDRHGISQATLRKSISVVPRNPDEFRSETYRGGSPASASDSPSSLAWLQKCASRIFKQSPGNRGESNIQRQETEIPANLVSERVLGVGVDPVSSGPKKIDYLGERANCNREREGGNLYSMPLANVIEFQPSSSCINRHHPNDKGRLRVFKRTRSMRGVVGSDNMKEPYGNDATLSGEKETCDNADSSQKNDQEREELRDNGKRDLFSGRKRRRGSFYQTTAEKVTEYVEVQTEITGGDQRKRQRETTSCSPRLENSNGKRYNFRDSTIASMMATCATSATSAECKEKDHTHGEEQYAKNSLECNLRENEEKGMMLLHEKEDDANTSRHKMLQELGEEMLEEYSCELTRVPLFKEIDKEAQASSSREVTTSGTGELCVESDGNEDDKKSGAQDFVSGEQDDEDDNEPSSLKEKLWNFLIT